MTDAQKRQYVSDLYSGPRWKRRVEKMHDDQVAAIYLAHINEGTVPEHNEEQTYVVEEHLEHLDTAEIEPEMQPEMLFGEPSSFESLIDTRPKTGLGPHHNEDDFPYL